MTMVDDTVAKNNPRMVIEQAKEQRVIIIELEEELVEELKQAEITLEIKQRTISRVF